MCASFHHNRTNNKDFFWANSPLKFHRYVTIYIFFLCCLLYFVELMYLLIVTVLTLNKLFVYVFIL